VGTVQPYYFIKEKIKNLEITPAQLALDPCTGSVVIMDPEDGTLLALVDYPG
jgi:penicillin-binding protein 2